MDKNIRRGKETVLRPATDASFKTSKPAFDEQFLAVVDDSGLFQLVLYPPLANAFTYCSKIIFRVGSAESTEGGEAVEQPGFSSDQDYQFLISQINKHRAGRFSRFDDKICQRIIKLLGVSAGGNESEACGELVPPDLTFDAYPVLDVSPSG